MSKKDNIANEISCLLKAALSETDAVVSAKMHNENLSDHLTSLLIHTEQAALAAREIYGSLAEGREMLQYPELVLPARMEEDEYGMVISIPALLPTRRRDGKYIRTTLQGLCWDRGRSFLRDVVVAVEQQYSKDTPCRSWRDHDNVELAGLLNELSLWVLAGDNPEDVDLFQFATRGEQNATVIYIIERAKFPNWAAKKWGKTAKIRKRDFTPCPPPVCIGDTGVFVSLHEPRVAERYTWQM